MKLRLKTLTNSYCSLVFLKIQFMESVNSRFPYHPWTIAVASMVAIMVAMVGRCQEKVVDSYPNTKQGAIALLQEFLKPGADLAALTKKLQPTDKDYGMAFKPELAIKMAEMYAKPWKDGLIVLSPKPGQTEVLLFSATSEELQKWTGNAKDFPGGYEKIGPGFADGFTFYRFKFVSPGEKIGMAFDGLVYVNGHWRLFPKPYRVLEEPKPKS